MPEKPHSTSSIRKRDVDGSPVLRVLQRHGSILEADAPEIALEAFQALARRFFGRNDFYFFRMDDGCSSFRLALSSREDVPRGESLEALFPRLRSLPGHSGPFEVPDCPGPPTPLSFDLPPQFLTKGHVETEKTTTTALIVQTARHPLDPLLEASFRNMCRLFASIVRCMENSEHYINLAFSDDLTCLFNFRFLRRYLPAQIRKCRKRSRSLSVLFIDIDNFKIINDTYGHLAGSAVLCELGSIIKAVVRDADAIIRYGGDEFVVVLPELDLDDAALIGERLRDHVAGAHFRGEASREIRLTISIGAAAFPNHAKSADALLKRADEAMYAAKAAGKNNIKICR